MTNILECEYLIVGSGAGGSTAFYELTQAGKDVLMIESGEEFEHDSYTVAESTQLTYRNGGSTVILGSPVVNYIEGNLLGGTTEINGGLFWRTPTFILEEWRKSGLNDLNEDNFRPIFERYEALLKVKYSNIEEQIHDYDSYLLSCGAKELNWKVVPVPRALNNCLLSNRCGSGCPTGAKQSMTKTLIPLGRKFGGKVLTNHRLLKIDFMGSKAKSIYCLNSLTGRKVNIGFKTLIIAAGAIQSPRILINNKITSPAQHSLGIHINIKILAKWESKVNAHKGSIFTSQIQEFIEDGILIMPTNFRREYLIANFARLDKKIYKEIEENYNNLALFTIQYRPESRAKFLKLFNNHFNHITFSRNDWKLFFKGLTKAAEVLFKSGATEVRLPFYEKSIKSIKEMVEVLDDTRISQFVLQTVHLMSSINLSNSNKSVLDLDGRIIGTENIYVFDASTLPTTVGESPQGSIMALTALLVGKLT